jgi:hypothetical protein
MNKTTIDSFFDKGVTPRNILPSLHKKTHFKGAATLYLDTNGILNISDGSIDNVLNDLSSIAINKGFKIPEYQNRNNNHRLNKSYDIAKTSKTLRKSEHFLKINDESKYQDSLMELGLMSLYPLPKNQTEDLMDAQNVMKITSRNNIDYQKIQNITR